MSAQRQRAYLSRPENARHANEEIADKAERLRFVSRVPMLCECSDDACEQFFLITLEEYRRARGEGDFLTLPGHPVAGAEAHDRPGGYSVQRERSSDHDC